MIVSIETVKILIRYDIEKNLTTSQKDMLYSLIENHPEIYELWKKMHDEHESDATNGRVTLLQRNDPLMNIFGYYDKKVFTFRLKLFTFIFCKCLLIILLGFALGWSANKPKNIPPPTKQPTDLKARISILWYKPSP